MAKYYLLRVDHGQVNTKAQVELRHYIGALLRSDGYDFPSYYIEVPQEEVEIYKDEEEFWEDAVDPLDYDYEWEAIEIAQDTWEETLEELPTKAFSPFSKEAKELVKLIYTRIEEAASVARENRAKEEDALDPTKDYPSEDETLNKELVDDSGYEDEEEGWGNDPKYADEELYTRKDYLYGFNNENDDSEYY